MIQPSNAMVQMSPTVKIPSFVCVFPLSPSHPHIEDDNEILTLQLDLAIPSDAISSHFVCLLRLTLLCISASAASSSSLHLVLLLYQGSNLT